ncbi:MAG: hypothetical protein JNL57_06010 [Bacteroidetes bacterium]|nr:hypothetical protein [Bacteroidota bacterium]
MEFNTFVWMRNYLWLLLLPLASCGVIEKSSRHDFHSGYYQMKKPGQTTVPVYVQMESEKVQVHPVVKREVDPKPVLQMNLSPNDSLCHYPLRFRRSSLDVDITTILMKYRFSTPDLPAQLNTDFNGALYLGWRHDAYRVSGKSDPLGTCRYGISNRGFDFGLLAGLTSVQMSPFTTGGKGQREYNAPALQYGFAVFAESNVASFGLAAGYDHLLGSERNIWIYRNKPWLGFVVGLALN